MLGSNEQWANLDNRGNWLDYRWAESMGGEPVVHQQTREANGVNEYPSIDPDGPDPEGGPPNALPVSLTYDAAGNLVVTRNPNWVYTKREYDKLNRLVRVIEDYQPGMDELEPIPLPPQLLDGQAASGTQGEGALTPDGGGSAGGGSGGGPPVGPLREMVAVTPSPSRNDSFINSTTLPLPNPHNAHLNVPGHLPRFGDAGLPEDLS